jgi:hypothetical protein
VPFLPKLCLKSSFDSSSSSSSLWRRSSSSSSESSPLSYMILICCLFVELDPLASWVEIGLLLRLAELRDSCCPKFFLKSSRFMSEGLNDYYLSLAVSSMRCSTIFLTASGIYKSSSSLSQSNSSSSSSSNKYSLIWSPPWTSTFCVRAKLSLSLASACSFKSCKSLNFCSCRYYSSFSISRIRSSIESVKSWLISKSRFKLSFSFASSSKMYYIARRRG